MFVELRRLATDRGVRHAASLMHARFLIITIALQLTFHHITNRSFYRNEICSRPFPSLPYREPRRRSRQRGYTWREQPGAFNISLIINFPRQDAGFAQEIVSTNIVVEMTLDGDKCLVHFISLHCLSSRFVSEMQTFAIETFDRVTK